jgi:putative nicotinate phosphoribosyltransferase
LSANIAGALLTDLYQLNMIQAYLDHGETKAATFEFFMRKLPARRGFLMAAGLEQALDYLEGLRFSAADIEWLAGTGRFRPNFLDYLSGFKFTGDVHAMPEGTIFFASEPILRITAPMPQAQLVESRLINILHFQSLVASKAARIVLAAPGRFRLASCPWRRSRSHGGARCLCGGLRRHRHSSGRAIVGHPDLRHHGAFLHPGIRRRGRSIREVRPLAPPEPDIAH